MLPGTPLPESEMFPKAQPSKESVCVATAVCTPLSLWHVVDDI